MKERSLNPSSKAFGLAVALVLSGAALFACGDDDLGAGLPSDVDAGEGGSADNDGSIANQPTKFSRANRGSAIDVSEDDTIVVTANRDVGTVTVFDVAYPQGAPPTLTKKAEIETCGEPWQVSLSPSGDRAFVVCRKDQKLVRIDSLRTKPVKGPEAKVGSEPTAVALTPKGSAAWVANWMDGTVNEIDTEKMTVTSTVDLNAALVETGTLGAVAPRPALAHPRSIAITNNRDDLENDESIFVTEFFGQQKEELAANGSNADVAKQGFVYRISARDKAVRTIPLPPIADIGIQDHNGNPAGCYPNQIQSIDVQGSFAYVVSICASPKGPLGDFLGPSAASCTTDAQCPGGAAGSCNTTTSTCTTNCTTDAQCGVNGGVCANNKCKENLWDGKTLQTPAVSVIDIGGNKVVSSVSMNGEFDKLYNDKGVPDTSARRMPLHSVDVAFVPGTLNAYFAAKGADAVFRMDFNATYETKAVDRVGHADKNFIQLDVGTLDHAKQGHTPIAISIAHGARADGPRRFGFVLNESSRNVTVLDLAADNIAGLPDNAAVASASPMPTDPKAEAVLEGKRLFEDGLGRWSFNGQAWGACSTCHWEGLSDQVTWFHRRGSRQSPSVDQTINKKNPNDIRAMNWQASSDELADNENGALRVVLGGVGAIVKNTDLTMDARIDFGKYGHSGLSGSINTAADPKASSAVVGEVCVIDDWQKIDAYEKQLRTPKKPSNLEAAKVTTGRAVFEEAKCQGCHGGDKWTLSQVFYTPDPAKAVNNALKTKSWAQAVADADFPTALLPAVNPAQQTMRYNGSNSSSFDVLTCLLRNVGTFGVAEPGVGVAELRRNMTSVAQGNEDYSRGYNVPSLLGMGVAAPYLHAGNARTLEAVLSAPFEAHFQALNAAFLAGSDPAAAEKRAALVQFLLSIDEETPTVAIPPLGPNGGTFCATP